MNNEKEKNMADSGEQFWINRAQSAEAKLATLKESLEPALERVKKFKANFGIREKSDGSIDIDFEKMVDRLGPVASMELKSVIEDKFTIRRRRHLKLPVRMNASP